MTDEKARKNRPLILHLSMELENWPDFTLPTEVESSGVTRTVYNTTRKMLKIGGQGDMVAGLAIGQHNLGANVAVAMPHWGVMGNDILADRIRREYQQMERAGIHHAEERLFLIRDPIFDRAMTSSQVYGGERLAQSIAFQRYCQDALIPYLKPDLVVTHCWTTGLIAGLTDIALPVIHIVHQTYSEKASKKELEAAGMTLWGYDRLYKDSWGGDIVNFQMSGIYASQGVVLPSQGWFLEVLKDEGISGAHVMFAHEIREKAKHNRATGIPNAPPTSYMSEIDYALDADPRYTVFNSVDLDEGKRQNKAAFQAEHRKHLQIDPEAPLFIWNNRLTRDKGAEHLIHTMEALMEYHQQPAAQIAIAADGVLYGSVREQARRLEERGHKGRILVKEFEDSLERKMMGAADCALNCSERAPCEYIPQKAGKYGVFTVAPRIGGFNDTIIDGQNGFHFGTPEDGFSPFSSEGLYNGICRFLAEYHGDPEQFRQKRRLAKKFADTNFRDDVMARRHLEFAERILAMQRSQTELYDHSRE